MRIPGVALGGCLWLVFQPHQVVAKDVHYDSIELITADSDVMVRGTIVEIGRLEDGDYFHWFKLVVRVTETLKGPKADELSTVLDSMKVSLDPKYDLWLKGKTELLFSLRYRPGDHSRCPFVLRPNHGRSIIELNGDGPGVVTMDFQVLTARGDILKAVRDGVAAAPDGGEKKRLRLLPPPSADIMFKFDIGFFAIYVWVPVDQRLEKRGERWASSKSVDYRALAPMALRPFKSDKNIVILKRLVSDDSHRDNIDARGYGTRDYPTRLPAYWVLKEWGVQVEKPVTEVPLRGNEDLVLRDRADSPAMDHALIAGGINSLSAFSSRRLTPISTIPTAPPLAAGR